MKLRTEKNYLHQKEAAITWGRNPWGMNIDPESEVAKAIGLNSKGGLDKVLFGTCDTCDNYFFENIHGGTRDADGFEEACVVKHCSGTVSQIHIIMEVEE